jgi:hypothetical protein
MKEGGKKMLVSKIEERLGITSKVGKARFSAIITAVIVFTVIWGGTSLFKLAPRDTILLGSIIAALFGAVLAFLKRLAEE